MIGILTGAAAGLLSAFGLGGGTLLLLWLTLFAGMPQQTAQAVNLLYFLPVSAASLPAHFRGGYLPLRSVLWAAGPGVLTAAGAAFFASRLETGLLRREFGIYLLVMGAMELANEKSRETAASGQRKNRQEPPSDGSPGGGESDRS